MFGKHSYRDALEERPGNADGSCVYPPTTMRSAHLWPFICSGATLWKREEVKVGMGKAGVGFGVWGK